MTETATWILTDGRAGMRGPAVGLAEATGLDFTEKRVVPAKPWVWLPTRFWPPGISGLGRGSDPVDPPYPDLLISCGRRAVGPARWLRARSRGRIFAVHILRPYVDTAAFDLVVAPAHDRLTGPNVLPVTGSLNRVTDAQLAKAAAHFASMFTHLPHPRIAVLIGGPNRVYRIDQAAIDRLADNLLRLVREHGASLAITASRRTGPAMMTRLRDRLRDAPAFIWDGDGENPYFGLLGLADAIVVTGDSVNMISEACTTGNRSTFSNSRAAVAASSPRFTRRFIRQTRRAPSMERSGPGNRGHCRRPNASRRRSSTNWPPGCSKDTGNRECEHPATMRCKR
jgi:mitochondrial fission protein ELM1